MKFKTFLTISLLIDIFTFPSVNANPLVWQFTKITEGGPFGLYSSPPSMDGKSVAFSYSEPDVFIPFFHLATGSQHGSGAYIDVNGKLITVAESGTPSPDNDNIFSSFGGISIDQGNVAFIATTNDTDNPNSPNVTGVYSYIDGILDTVADTNTDIPEGIGKFTEGTTGGPGFGIAPSIDSDTVILIGSSVERQEGIYSKTPDGELKIIADTNTSVPFSVDPLPDDLPPDATGNFNSFSLIPSIDDGNVAFAARFSLSAGSLPFATSGVYNVIDGELVVVADRFTSLPQSPENSFPVFDISPSFDQGDTVFFVEFGDSDPDSAQNLGHGTYANIDGTIQKIAETGGLWPSIDNANIAFDTETTIQTTIGGVLSEVWDDNFIPKEELAPAGPKLVEFIEFGPDSLNGNSIAFVIEISDLDFGQGFTGIIRADLDGLNFPDFTDSDYLTLNGDAFEEEAILILTADELGKSGSAFFSSPLILSSDSSFNTHFAFKISGENSSGPQASDGLAFVIHSDSRKASAIGNSGKGLGFGLNNTTGDPVARIEPSIAIEFDTHKDSFDPDGNHVALIVNGDVSNHIAQASLPCSNEADSKCLNSGKTIYAWIDYHGAGMLLRVYLSETDVKPTKPIISEEIDIFSQIGEQAFFGFSAATGDGKNQHKILNWQISFDLEGDFNGDSCIDREDLTEMILAIRSGSEEPKFDVNKDGTVNIADARKLVTLFTKARGVSCSID